MSVVAGEAVSAGSKDTVVRMPSDRFPARACPPEWAATCTSAKELLVRLTAAPFALERPDKQAKRVNGITALINWLADQPGRTWQERWLSSGADAAEATWREVPTKWLCAHGHETPWRHEALIEALPVAISADVFRPSLPWLVNGGPAHGGLLVRNLAASRDPEGFARLAAACDADPGVSATARGQVLYRAALIVAGKGGRLQEITVGDVIELLDAQIELRSG